jgi:hypothetical protein
MVETVISAEHQTEKGDEKRGKLCSLSLLMCRMTGRIARNGKMGGQVSRDV